MRSSSSDIIVLFHTYEEFPEAKYGKFNYLNKQHHCQKQFRSHVTSETMLKVSADGKFIKSGAASHTATTEMNFQFSPVNGPFMISDDRYTH